MTSTLTLLSCIVFCAVFFNLSTCSLTTNFENNLDLNSFKPDQDKESSMLFRPKIHRKKRLEKQDVEKLIELLETLESQGLVEDYPWTLTTVEESNDLDKRSHTHNFTPRLGRNLEESHLSDDEGVIERSPPFSPRLGRRLKNQYSPRLGRDDGMVYL
ncbi:PBAN-type neuropeptides-like [Rhynchophorus ferrugineus]|uniref:Uncharacterized protein n=1 Tax=Rhynchophorus ferrugineus TaxID=354439 RepID=A0A834HZP2_RHYFE|nr:hypothetical protein GWI33_015467 [Rhynchophorus ferrugineus]